MVWCIISSVCSLLLISFAGISILNHESNSSQIVFYVMQIIFALIQAMTAIITSVFLFRKVCCQNDMGVDREANNANDGGNTSKQSCCQKAPSEKFEMAAI